jgi:hypothetical protein
MDRPALSTTAPVSEDGQSRPGLQIGILTKGKPTLGMVLSSLLLQDTTNIRIQIVDTGETPVMRRSDVNMAMRLAHERGIYCGYEFSRERRRAFSLGRRTLLETMTGPYTCFVDDDIVMPSGSIREMLAWAGKEPECGFVAPVCRNSPIPHGVPLQSPRYCPGAVFRQDAISRKILLEYYETCVDVLDRETAYPRHWEVAFLTALFQLLGRRCHLQQDNIIYHLDYQERANWDLDEPSLTARSVQMARELIDKHSPSPALNLP